MAIRFEWHARKADQNSRKHGVTFQEAETAFGDAASLTIYDPDHSITEDRFVTLGLSCHRRLLVVVHTDRGDAIRIISARRASRREKETYEKKA